MKMIKGMLEGELKKAILEEKEYEKALAGLPRGVLVKKYVKGRQYCYLLFREKGKVRLQYKGKLMGHEVRSYEAVRTDRVRQRQKLAEVRKRIAGIRKILGHRALRAV